MNPSRSPILVSVVVPAWNAGRYLSRTLDTVFSQTLGADRIQVVVADDGSTDDTPRILQEYGGRITSLCLDNSGGPSRPRNRAIDHSVGEYVAFFDSDDLMEPDKLSVAVGVFERYPEVDLVFSGFRSIDMAGSVLKEDYLEEYVEFRKDLKPTTLDRTWLLAGESAFRSLLRANYFGTSSVVCRRRLFEEVGRFDEDLKNADDIDMWLRIAAHGHVFAFVDRALHSYRINPDGVSARGPGRLPSVLKGLENTLKLCRDAEDRAFVTEQIRRLHLAHAWALRQKGDFPAAIEGYRKGLAMGWDGRGWVGLLKCHLLARLKTH